MSQPKGIHESLRDLLSYDPLTGEFTWKRRRKSGGVREGAQAGSINSHGYRKIAVNGKTLSAHRLAFLLMGEPLGTLEVDHINGNTQDNRWVNLRAVSKAENMKNKRPYRRPSPGLSGVTFRKDNQRWRVRINKALKHITLGHFSNLLDAAACRKAAELTENYHENHGRYV